MRLGADSFGHLGFLSGSDNRTSKFAISAASLSIRSFRSKRCLSGASADPVWVLTAWRPAQAGLLRSQRGKHGDHQAGDRAFPDRDRALVLPALRHRLDPLDELDLR